MGEVPLYHTADDRGFTRKMTKPGRHTIRWSTHLSSKVNLPYAIDFKASCGAYLVT
jgi:hypothetical protein